MTAAPKSEKTFQPVIDVNASYEIPLPPKDLPYDDGEPLETNQHRIAMNVLIQSLKQAWSDRTDFFAGGNMFIYFSSTQARNQDFRGPDFFVVQNIDDNYSRLTWTVWEEGGRYPDVIVELLSQSTAEADLGIKKNIYERVFRTPDYFVFDPFDSNSLQGWCLDGLRYQPLVSNEQGWLWSQSLGLWLGIWEGTIEQVPGVWLRFYDTSGQLVPLPEEAARQEAAEAQQQAAEAQQQLAETQQQLAETQQRTAEMEAMLAYYRQHFGEPSE